MDLLLTDALERNRYLEQHCLELERALLETNARFDRLVAVLAERRSPPFSVVPFGYTLCDGKILPSSPPGNPLDPH